jgi:hypothetical protein
MAAAVEVLVTELGQLVALLVLAVEVLVVVNHKEMETLEVVLIT